MRTLLKLLVTMCLILAALAVVACGGMEEQPSPTPIPAAEATAIPTAVPDPTIDPVASVVLDMVERVNAEDYAGAAELVADDMVTYLIGMPPTGMEIYRGREQFRTFLEECCTGQHFEWQVTPERVEDGAVYAEAKTWMDFTRDLGVAPNSFHEIFVVDDGKISLYASTMDEDALANFKPALREAVPDLFEVKLPSDETPVNEVTITISDGTCAYDGPMTLKAGQLTVNVEVRDQNWDKYAASFFTLDEGKDLIDLMASTYGAGPPSWSDMVFLKEMGPNESETITSLQVKEGLLYMICWAGSPDIPIGNAGPFLVTP
jgi:ketosteroid isomerase-like protein